MKHELEKKIGELKKRSESQNKLFHMLSKQQLSQLKGKEKKPLWKCLMVID